MKYFSRSHYRGKTLRPPDRYEYFVDNFWFKAADLEHQKINEPLRGSCRADALIVEGACCGYGASERSGGFCILTSLLDWQQKDP